MIFASLSFCPLRCLVSCRKLFTKCTKCQICQLLKREILVYCALFKYCRFKRCIIHSLLNIEDVFIEMRYDCLYKTTIDSGIGSLLDLYQKCQMFTQNRNGSKVSRKVLRQYVQYTSSVTNMLRELKWSTLEQRRNRASLVMLDVTKDNNQVNVDYSHLKTTRNNKFLMSEFFPWAIQLWNRLQTEIKMPQLFLHLQVA